MWGRRCALPGFWVRVLTRWVGWSAREARDRVWTLGLSAGLEACMKHSKQLDWGFQLGLPQGWRSFVVGERGGLLYCKRI
jgi:hypothetical protein